MNKLELFVLAIILVTGSYGSSLIIKDILKIPRPCVVNKTCLDVRNPYDVPSSHTTVAFSLAVFLSLTLRRRWLQVLLICGATLVGIERLVINFHSVLGVVSGVVLGAFVGLLWYYAARLSGVLNDT